MFYLLTEFPAVLVCCLQVASLQAATTLRWTRGCRQLFALVLVPSLLAMCHSPLLLLLSLAHLCGAINNSVRGNELRAEHRKVPITSFDGKTAKQLARVLCRPLQCRTCDFGPVDHYLCDNISTQHCPLCFARADFLADGYRDWDPTTNFSRILAKAHQQSSRHQQNVRRDSRDWHMRFIHTGAAVGVMRELCLGHMVQAGLLWLLWVTAVVVASLCLRSRPMPNPDNKSCAVCDVLMSKSMRRRAKRYPCGHRAHAQCRTPTCVLCEL
jgi:hypothetical protein